MTRPAARVHIGTSGFQYRHWRGVLYPPDLPRRDWLHAYCRAFDSVEINNTFYGLPEPSTFDAWRAASPPGFHFALKLSRHLTHMKKLRDPAEALARFLERAEHLGDRLGPLLVQLPPRWRRDPGRLRDFLAQAPSTARWAVEFRDASWLHDTVYQVLADHHAALVVHDLLARHPRTRTTDFVYLRFHGNGYGGRYSPQKLAATARWLRRLRDDGVTAWVFFDNDRDGCAVHDARALRRHLTGAGIG
jgi:uncharacterized protein YecE (DUF72 family)